MRKLLIILLAALLIPTAALAQEGLQFSLESGFYDQEIELEILCDDPEAEIYYTLDGTVPTEDSFYYDEPFFLEDRTWEDNDLSARDGVARTTYLPTENVVKGHVIRAMAIYPNGSQSDVISGTFFVGVDREAHYADVPVFSLMMNPDDLFDFETGIYVLGKEYVRWHAEQTAPYEDWQTQGNFSLRGKEWERLVTVQYLTADGSEGFTMDMGMRIKGAVSRASNQKSLRLIAREEYGEKQLKYPVFPGNQRADGTGPVEKYKSITLRNGGNDVESSRLRDPYFQHLAQGLNFMTQASEPCVVFINGEYWGMYNITEEYSDHAIENNFGVDNNNVIIIKNGRLEEGVESDLELFEEMYDFISQNDMRDPDNYAKAAGMIDLPAFAQYCAFHLFINNTDGLFQNNNWMMWRVRQTDDTPYGDGVWRLLMFDTESAADIWGDGRNFGADNITPAIVDDGFYLEGRHMQKFFYSLYQNESFRREMILALCDVRNINFRMPYAGNVLKEMRPIYEELMPETFRRFGPDWVVLWNLDNHHREKLELLATYMRGRYDRFPSVLREALSFSAPVKAKISLNDHALGQLQINRTLLPAGEELNAMYFSEVGITLTAIPAPGATFKGWETDGCTLDDPTALTVNVSFTGDFTIQAIFE